jgi:hypothetical protein
VGIAVVNGSHCVVHFLSGGVPYGDFDLLMVVFG